MERIIAAVGSVLLGVIICVQALPDLEYQIQDQRTLLQDEDFASVDFDLAKELLEQRMEGKAYSSVMELTHLDECVEYFDDVFPQDCKLLVEVFKPEALDLCCEALRNLVDKGLCLCEAQVNQGLFLFGAGPVSTMAALCGVEFPIPNDDASLLLENPYGISDKCEKFRETDINGDLSPEFLGIPEEQLESVNLEELPGFGAFYEPRQPGPFYVNYKIIDVPRLEPSILVNDFSTESEFKALVVYPTDFSPIKNGRRGPKRMRNQEMSSEGPFPVMAFSPGFGISPTKHIRTFYQLASHGIIVISQYSTHKAVVDVTEEVLRAWVDDIVTGLWHVTDKSKGDEFFEGKVDADKLVVAGHSMGGGLSMVASVKAMDEFGLNVRATIPISPACKMRGNECDMATEAAENLRGVDVLFIGGDEDAVERVEYSEYFMSLIPEGSSKELMVLKGATHCLWEAAPSTWRQSLQCGKGTKSPFDAIVEMQDAMVRFLGGKGLFSKPDERTTDDKEIGFSR